MVKSPPIRINKYQPPSPIPHPRCDSIIDKSPIGSKVIIHSTNNAHYLLDKISQ